MLTGIKDTLLKKKNIPILVWLMFIWGQSCMPPGVSSGESGAVLKIIQTFFPFVTHVFIRKLGHFSEYALLGLLCSRNYSVKHIMLFCWIAAFLDESIQILSGRGPAIADVWIDFAGAAAGTLLMYLLRKVISKKRVRRMKTEE